ncbi:hypothetical protein K458DRAFT_86597 [Lentithecium fluviatile CBS 122367]|uniref:Uncharacterized protein n=1 Tax=Lentithecium fluviatile CBS 122367 TaxID=1168545 RepID=A0A6G1ISA2_9PLEO|nr:hypothetical protein K458DRAFT_86597 [Lentithecium fluviatile CBS 122367]
MVNASGVAVYVMASVSSRSYVVVGLLLLHVCSFVMVRGSIGYLVDSVRDKFVAKCTASIAFRRVR